MQPLPTPQHQQGSQQGGAFGESSDFSFDEGFASSDESQAYNGDTQSIDTPAREESSISMSSSLNQPNDADDSDLSDASSGNLQHSQLREGAQEQGQGLPRRQSGLQRLADGFQSRSCQVRMLRG